MTYYENAKKKYREMEFTSESDRQDFDVPFDEWRDIVSNRKVDDDVLKIGESVKYETTISSDKHSVRILFIKKSLTTIKADAVINAANEALLGGGGIDHAIHSSAGSNLVRDCAYLNGCEVGQAVITKGYNLPAVYVIHTVAPLLSDDDIPDATSLLSCYTESLKLCDTHNLSSLIIPLLGCGFYAFPISQSASIVKSAIAAHVSREGGPSVKTFVLSFVTSSSLKSYLKVFGVDK